MKTNPCFAVHLQMRKDMRETVVKKEKHEQSYAYQLPIACTSIIFIRTTLDCNKILQFDYRIICKYYKKDNLTQKKM